MYDEDWRFIVVQTGENTIKTWVVLRGETQYYIVDGQVMDVKTYNREVLK